MSPDQKKEFFLLSSVAIPGSSWCNGFQMNAENKLSREKHLLCGLDLNFDQKSKTDVT